MTTNEEVLAQMASRHESTVFHTLGIQILSLDPDAIVLAIDIDHRHLQHAGVVHGGVHVLLAESAASMAAAMKVDLAKYNVFGMEINANHLRPMERGRVVAQATQIFQGKSTMVYGIEIRDGNGDLVSISRCTLAVRPKHPAS